MNDNFTYDKPNDKDFFSTLIKYLKRIKKESILNIIKSGSCAIVVKKTFSNIRWNAKGTEIIFSIPEKNLDLTTTEMRKELKNICASLIPQSAGLDVKYVEFIPIISNYVNEKSLISDIDKIKSDIQSNIKLRNFSQELIDKGKAMSEVYTYLYFVENSIRLFIESIAKENFGNEYWNHLSISTEISKNIKSRKEKESKQKYISKRGEADIYYCDFKDLGTIICNDWKIFSKYFSTQSWIKSKIEELADCRNLVAHNNYITQHGIDIIKVTFKSILIQMGYMEDNSTKTNPF